MVSSALQAIGLFLVTNIDDIIVLSLFFARGAGQRGTTAKIVLGQYLGFSGILLASLAVTLGAGLFLPVDAIPYFVLRKPEARVFVTGCGSDDANVPPIRDHRFRRTSQVLSNGCRVGEEYL